MFNNGVFIIALLSILSCSYFTYFGLPTFMTSGKKAADKASTNEERMKKIEADIEKIYGFFGEKVKGSKDENKEENAEDGEKDKEKIKENEEEAGAKPKSLKDKSENLTGKSKIEEKKKEKNGIRWASFKPSPPVL